MVWWEVLRNFAYISRKWAEVLGLPSPVEPEPVIRILLDVLSSDGSEKGRVLLHVLPLITSPFQ
jgi:uncharacterized protein YqjF (DUF2071 family)